MLCSLPAERKSSHSSAGRSVSEEEGVLLGNNEGINEICDIFGGTVNHNDNSGSFNFYKTSFW